MRDDAGLRCRGCDLRNPDEGGAGPRGKHQHLPAVHKTSRVSQTRSLVLLKKEESMYWQNWDGLTVRGGDTTKTSGRYRGS